MTTATQNVVFQLVEFARRGDVAELRAHIAEIIDDTDGQLELVYALVLIIVGVIEHGTADRWNKVVAQLALEGDD